MTTYTIEESQRAAAKLAGFLYLLTMLAANFSEFYVRRQLFVHGDAGQTAMNIAASDQLFRIGIACDLITLAGELALAAALYVVLQHVNRTVALIAAFWWLECAIGAAVTLSNVAALFLLRGTAPEQLRGLAQIFISLDTAGNRIAGTFFGLGSILFCYLWFRSRYIPRLLAAWGIVASLLPATVQLAAMFVNSLQEAPLRRAKSGIPIVIFEVILGFWLLVKGIGTPRLEQTPAELVQDHQIRS